MIELQVAALACEDPKLAAALQAIADDELRHATLAWRFVRWALAHAPGLAPAVVAVFDSLTPSEPAPDPASDDERELLRAHGCLPADERRLVHNDALHGLLRPCASALATPDILGAQSEASA
jgi:hypothetical protein